MENKIIVLDPGHGGKDPGASGNGLVEKDITLLIAYKVEKNLANYNTTVYLTRGTDKTVSLSDRAKFANDKNADLFVSIHVDANKSSEASGATSYRHTNAGEQTKNIQNLIHIEYSKILLPNDMLNRGCRTANFAVLRETNMPAILIENGFITNQKDAANLKSNQILEELARGITDGIVRALSLVRKETVSTLETDLAILQKAGVKIDPSYWITNAIPGKTVKGEYAAALIQKFAQKLGG